MRAGDVPTWLYEAAVLPSFQLDDLQVAPDSEELKALAVKRRDKSYTLPLSVRRKVLQVGGLSRIRDQVLNALKRGIGDESTLTLLRRLLDGSPDLDIKNWSLEEIRRAQFLTRWIEHMSEQELLTLPSQEDLNAIYEQRKLTEPLRQALKHFRGREQQLLRLHQYVSGDSPGPMLLHGVGGSGKTTLLSKFILERMERGDCVVFIDLDQAELSLQLPSESKRERTLAQDPRVEFVLTEISRQISAQREDKFYIRKVSKNAKWARRTSALGGLVDQLSRIDTKVVLIIDTFEEAQYQDSSDIMLLFRRLFDELRDAHSGMRIILGGRAELAWAERSQTLSLDALEEAEAVALLRAVAGATTLTAAEAKSVVERVGCQPLLVVIAGQALDRDPELLRDLAGLERDTAAAYMYRRILDHIHDIPSPELIEPSLILRRLTPELLVEVIAPIVGLELTEAQAREHLQCLRAEVSLVQASGEGVKHRVEVRSLCLPTLQMQDEVRWFKTHDSAAQWWSQQVGDLEGADSEEMYHRLVIWDGQSPLPTWRAHWKKELSLVVQEKTLPEASRSYLLDKGLGLEEEILSESEAVLLEAEKAFSRKNWQRLEALLKNQAEPSARAIYLHAIARERQNARKTHLTLMARALKRAEEEGDWDLANEASLRLAAWFARKSRWPEAVRVVDQAFHRAEEPLWKLRLLDRRHRLAPLLSDQDELSRVLSDGVIPEIEQDVEFLRDLVSWDRSGALIQAALNVLDFEGWQSHDLESLVDAIAGDQNAFGEHFGLLDEAFVDREALLALLRGSVQSAELSRQLRVIAGKLVEHEEELARLLVAVGDESDAGDWRAYVRVLASNGLTDQRLYWALEEAFPSLKPELLKLWRMAAFRWQPKNTANSFQSLYIRRQGFPTEINTQLRLGWGNSDLRPNLYTRMKDLLEEIFEHRSLRVRFDGLLTKRTTRIQEMSVNALVEALFVSGQAVEFLHSVLEEHKSAQTSVFSMLFAYSGHLEPRWPEAQVELLTQFLKTVGESIQSVFIDSVEWALPSLKSHLDKQSDWQRRIQSALNIAIERDVLLRVLARFWSELKDKQQLYPLFSKLLRTG